MDKFDVCIVGAGVIGLAIAHELSGHPAMAGRSIVVLEQESGCGQHTSSRNSEVIHAGLYYPPHSLKAQLCVRGKQLLYAHCERYQVPFQRIGKYLVAQDTQYDDLQRIAANAASNGVDDLQLLDRNELQRAEPAVTAAAALFSPSTGIIDSHGYMESLLRLAQDRSVHFAPFTTVTHIDRSSQQYLVECDIRQRQHHERYRFQAATVINSAGLGAQSLAASIAGVPAGSIPRGYLCKGDYFAYTGKSPLRHLVYPLPEAQTSGLGIHGTLDLGGQLRFGPDTDYIDAIDYRIDASKAARYAAAIARYFPAIRAEQLVPAYAGIRPKLVAPGAPAGDFLIQNGLDYGLPGLIQLYGMESPGLTASLAIGETVTRSIVEALH